MSHLINMIFVLGDTSKDRSVLGAGKYWSLVIMNANCLNGQIQKTYRKKKKHSLLHINCDFFLKSGRAIRKPQRSVCLRYLWMWRRRSWRPPPYLPIESSRLCLRSATMKIKEKRKKQKKRLGENELCGAEKKELSKIMIIIIYIHMCEPVLFSSVLFFLLLLMLKAMWESACTNTYEDEPTRRLHLWGHKFTRLVFLGPSRAAQSVTMSFSFSSGGSACHVRKHISTSRILLPGHGGKKSEVRNKKLFLSLNKCSVH